MRLAASVVLLAAAASSSCGDGYPATPSPVGPSSAAGVTLRLGPADYHEPMPGSDPAPAPAAVTISIVGSSGAAAFAPNPLQTTMGRTVAWTNNDATVHQIVLGDGTMIGTINPGQTSAPVTIGAAVTYRCTFHPSMTGTIQDPSAAPGPAPEPPPDSYPPPPDDGYGYYGHS